MNQVSTIRLALAASLLGSAAVLAQDELAADEQYAYEWEPPAPGTQSPEPQPLDTIALPQPEAEPLPARASSSRFIEEMVVTAQKREENLQDVPLSVQAFSGELLDAMGITDQTDLQRVTPGLNVTSQVSYVMTFLRGIGTDATIAADPSVATYIDGIYYPFASNLAQNFGAVDRIEVLKGPQGTLFGRNATGGAIAIYTKEPDFSEVQGELLASFGSFDSRLFRVHANLPLGERFALNVTGVRSTTDGYYSGTRGAPPEPLPRDETTGFRVKLRAQPIDALDIRLAMFKLDMYSGAGSTAFTANPSLLGSLQGVEPQTGYEGSVDAYAFAETDDNTVYYGSVTYAAPWLDVKLIGSDQRMDTAGIRDFDGSPRPLSTFETPSQYIDSQSWELQLLSNGDVGPDWLEWILGAYYFRATNGFGSLNFVINGIDLGAGRIAGIALPPALVDFLRSMPGAPTGAINLSGLIGTDSRAAFAQASFSLGERLALTLGGRYQVEERFIVESTVGLATQDGSQSGLIDNSDRAADSNGDPYPAHDRQSDFSPKATLQLRPFADDTLLFLSWQQAVKAATYNTIAIYEAPDYVAPEEIEAWELGLKTTLFDGILRFNAAAFHYDVENLQTYYLSMLAGGVISFQNAGRARIRGADFDGMLRLFPSLVDDLVLSGGLAYLDAEYLDFDGASGFSENGTFASNQNYSGNRVIRTPELSATLSLAKTWHVAGGPLETVFDAYYTDEFFYEASNREASRQPAYWLLGARLSYLYERWGLRGAVGVRNLADERYTAGYFATDYGVQPTLAPPRSYFLQLTWSF